MNDKQLQGILDITPPSAPWQYAWEVNAVEIASLGLLLVGLLIVTGIILWRRYFSTRGKARLQIGRLHKQLNSDAISNKQAAFQLAHTLQQALKLTRLSPRTNLPHDLQVHHPRWQAFTEALSLLRYAETPAVQPHVSRLIDDAYFWLRHWPRHD